MPDTLQRMLRRLTGAYDRRAESNIGKLLGIVAGEIDDVDLALQTIRAYRCIDEAAGETLDRIGYNVQQLRGQATDPVYRILIKTKIARNLSDGSVDTLIQVLAIALQVDYEEVIIEEMWPAEPAIVRVTVPTGPLLGAGFSLVQFGRLVNAIVAAGVRAWVLMGGTFAFSSQWDEVETDSEAGFADLDQTMGGYFGAVYDPADDPDLPI